MIDTLIISDIHLGSSVCNREKVLEVLDIPFNTLIINGDLFDNHSFHRYTRKDWKILTKIRKLSKTHKVILVKGNHDGCAEFLAAITGMEFTTSYSFQVNERQMLCEHGDEYDHWVQARPVSTFVFTGLYYWVQKFDKKNIITRRLKAWSKSWVRAKDIVSKKFLAKHGREYDVIMAGHTHYPEEVYSSEYSCTYINSGSFCDKMCSCIVIDKQGVAKLTYIV
jgi:UDP-2,3-diacylglucosamine pyrophosphatase LpxH